jgi:hypothetical protein
MRSLQNLLLALASLTRSTTSSTADNATQKDPNRPFKIGDKVKKQYFTRSRFPGKSVEISSEFYYGTIVLMENNGYATVSFRHQKILDTEMLSDLIHVPDDEWRYICKQHYPPPIFG